LKSFINVSYRPKTSTLFASLLK